MAIDAKIARPYARAAFDFAKAKQDIVAWEAFLNVAQCMVQDARVFSMLSDPRVSVQQQIAFFEAVCAQHLDAARKNFLALLIEYGRVLALPTIYTLFYKHRQAESASLNVEVTSAWPLESGEVEQLSRALAERFSCEIQMKTQEDRSLLGGMVVRAGDFVMDASIRDRLRRMRAALID